MTTRTVMNLVVLLFLPILGSLAKIIPEVSLNGDTTVVKIPDGDVLGTKNKTIGKGSIYYTFKGIPYAKPPLGDLRFAAPVKNSNWTGYLDATQESEVCVQGSADDITGSEDCLYVNVYTPTLKEKNLPVMVWIYGGAFTSGSSRYDAFGPDYLLEKGVVYVSFNYRLGVLGFLSTDDKTASGNWGLKDQVLALKWIRDNIKYFGGNPDKVTIFGESAGGASVSYLLQIPQAQGLFHAAIMQSGTSEMLWSLSTKARQTAFQVGRGVGIFTVLSRTLVKRLRNVDAYTLQEAAMTTLTQVFISNPLRGLPFSPVIEGEHEGAVFTQSSDDYFRSGLYPNKVPVLIGHNSNEAAAAQGLSRIFCLYLLLVDITNEALAPFSLTSNPITRRLAARKVQSFFFGNSAVRNQPESVVKFINIDQFNRGTRRVAENIAPHAPVYFYIFGYEGDQPLESPHPGVGHGEHLAYLFRTDSDDFSERDKKVRTKLVTLFTNFAKSKNPTPTNTSALDNVIWPSIDPNSDHVDYLWINETLSLGKNPDQEEYDFYQNLFDRYGDGSYSTY